MKNILLSIWIIVSLTSASGLEYHTYADQEAQSKKVGDDEGDKKSDKEKGDKFQLLIQIDKALSNSVSIPIQADLNGEFEFPEFKTSLQKIHQVYHLCQSEFYRVLFRSIISPNAP